MSDVTDKTNFYIITCKQTNSGNNVDFISWLIVRDIHYNFALNRSIVVSLHSLVLNINT